MSGVDVTTYRAGIVGQPSTGKSTLLWLLTLALPTVWLFDPCWDFQTPPNGRRYRPRVADRDSSRGGIFHDEVQHVCKMAQATGGMTVIIDEAWKAVKLGQQGPEAVADLFAMGRHFPPPPARATGVGIVVAAQLLKQCPTDWWASCEHLFVFRMTAPAQLQVLKSMGFDPSAVATLQVGEFFHLHQQGGGKPHKHAHALDGACASTAAADAAAA